MSSYLPACPNGHPVARPGSSFCETCGAPIGAPGGGLPPAYTPNAASPASPSSQPASPIGPRSRGGLATPLVLGLVAIFAVVAGVGAYVAMAPHTAPSPSMPAVLAAATPTQGEISPAVPSAPAATKSNAAAAATRTPARTASAAPSHATVTGKSCHNDQFGVTVIYPTTWYTYTGDAEQSCAYFDTKPVVATGASSQGLVAITGASQPMATVVSGYQSAGGKVLLKQAATVDGKKATLLEIDDSGNGVAPDGMREYMYLVDLGQTTLVVSTQGIFDETFATEDWPYDGYKDNIKVVDSIAMSLKFG